MPNANALADPASILRSMLANSADCIKILDLDGKLLYMSEPGQRALAIEDVEAVLGQCWTAFWSGKDRKCAEGAVAKARDGGVGEFEGYFARLTGEPRWWHVVVTPIRGPDGRTDRLLAVSRDITSRKRTEESLQKSESSFRMLANQMPQICWVTAPTGEVAWLNQRWYEFSGLTEEESLGYGWRQAHSPDALTSLEEAFQKAVADGSPFEFVHQIRGGDNKSAWFLTRATPVRDESGKVVRWFGTSTDIDKRINDEQERKRLLAELKRSNQELTAFAQILSHDLQAHVRAVLTFSQLLNRKVRKSLDRESVDYLDNIEGGARQMNELILTVLDFSTTGLRASSDEADGFE